ncbi:MAG: threonine--tRNA ligase, partial [Clostridiaceae bacterium]|nr:threonine--tRNA ligase [Clostridiaceae bacterium]
MEVVLKDGSRLEVGDNASVYDVAEKIGAGLARATLAGEVNGQEVDLRTKVPADSEIAILTFDDEYGQEAFHHSSSHLLAQAVKRLYPDAKLAIGPAIDYGFYYDIEFSKPISDSDLEKIEAEMQKIVKEDLPIEKYTLSRDESIDFYKKEGENYKVELIEDLPEDAEISFYKQGEFTDLCAGPHIKSTGQIKAFKLTSLAGAYWRGDEHNTMLTRIYGTSFPKKKQLEEHLARLEEAKKRDHRKIGREMGLFMTHEAGPGFPFFLPNGMVLKNSLLEYWRELHDREGYDEIESPIILSRKLWEESGHWDHYKDNMYTTVIDEEDFAIKPMNCPGAMLVFSNRLRSYRDLPLRLAELGRVHRHELSGALHGLMRVRAFTQDDAHIFMLPEQMIEEITGVIRLIDEVYTKFGFKYHVELSTRPEEFLGEVADWDRAEENLKEALAAMDLSYKINEGDGAFYGPKIDFEVEDSLGRTWQCGTIQLDFQMPIRFDTEYTGSDGEKHRPIVIHRVVYGSIERFIGILIEHYAGNFPLWLAPQQVVLIPVNKEAHGPACYRMQ